jgi:predicted metal-dependent HD superfamily phosphohydrolase
MLRGTFIALVKKFSDDERLINKLWKEIEKTYTKSNRHYHTLHHLDNLLIQLSEIQSEIKKWDAVLFALFYHDIIYNVMKNDNEEKSAQLAIKRLMEIEVHGSILDACNAIIVSTKKHLLSNDSDVNFFIDADISILGSTWNNYLLYAQQVRKEYSIFPDFIYNPGRKKVLEHFLSMKKIFKTNYFASKFEEKAKQNLKQGLLLLG